MAGTGDVDDGDDARHDGPEGPADEAARTRRQRIETARALSASYLPTKVEPYRRIGLFLGPYRNLTTLTAAILSLHPDCLVLNHGLNRIVGRPGISFLARMSTPEYARFLRFTRAAARTGHRGDHGGSISHSHAFTRSRMVDAADELVPSEHPTTLVWKDSMRITNYLRLMGRPPTKVVRRNWTMRMLLPMRNPLDCTVSNIRTGHARYLPVTDATDPRGVLDAILQELVLFERRRLEQPEAFVSFYEDDDGQLIFERLADALALEPHPRWLELASKTWAPENSYDHDPALVDQFDRRIAAVADEVPELAARLTALVHGTSRA
jgi:hypothetical protein